MIEIINEKFYDILNKTEELRDPKTIDLFKDVLDLIVLVMERQNSFNDHIDTNVMGLAGDMGTLHKEVINNKCCGTGQCGTPQSNQPKQNNNLSDDILDIASFIVSDDSKYSDYINNKRKETKEFVKSINGDTDDEELSKDIAVLSNFIEKKIRK